MRRTLGILFKVLVVGIVIGWIGLILTEYFRYQDNSPMLVVLKEKTIAYDDGHVYVNWGLGYKTITYERTSIYGKEFGHIFIKVRETLPKNN